MAPLPENAQSSVLGRRALVAFNRLGDLMIPGGEGFPSFSETGCIAHIDDMMPHAPQDDVKSLNLLLTVLGYCPTFILRGIVWTTDRGRDWPEPVGTLVRMLDTGLRSVVVSLYFSGKSGGGFQGATPLDLIDYHLTTIRPE